MGNRALEMSGMMDAVISLCASEDAGHQQIAVEALIHAAGKAKRASFITANGVALLKDLYKKSENEQIRVRALVVSVAEQTPGEKRLGLKRELTVLHDLLCRVCASSGQREERISA